MIPLRFQTGGSNLFLTMPNGGNVGPMGASPMGLPQYGMGANYAFLKMQDGGDADMDGDDQSFYSNRMNTFIQKIRNNAEKNLESAIMEQGQEPPMAQYGMNMNSDPMNSYDPGNLGAFARTSNYLNSLSKNAISGYRQRMGALGPNNYYYKEKNIYRDKSKGAPLGTQLFTDADGNQSSISPEEAYNRANYALYSRQHGGGLPRAQKGIDWEGISNPDLLKRAVEMGHNSVEEYKNSGWGYGKNHWEYKAPPTYPSRVRINDPRTINATSGKPINANVDLKSGDYHTGVIGEIARAARAYGQNPQELMAIALQETNLGKADPNYGHVLDYYDPEDRGSAYDLAFAKTEKDKVAAGKGFGDNELLKLQTYNGLGTVYPSTEAGYHGFNMSSIYGVPLTGAGINMVENPLYGKRIVDLRDNVLKNSQNAEYNQFLDKYNRDLANEEAVSQKQIAAYDLFNRINPEYGQQYATMLQNAYADSLSNSSNSEYIYPERDLDFGYSVPNLDNTRQRNALDRFNRAIGYQQIPFRDGGALTKYQQDINSGQPGTVPIIDWSNPGATLLVNGAPAPMTTPSNANTKIYQVGNKVLTVTTQDPTLQAGYEVNVGNAITNTDQVSLSEAGKFIGNAVKGNKKYDLNTVYEQFRADNAGQTLTTQQINDFIQSNGLTFQDYQKLDAKWRKDAQKNAIQNPNSGGSPGAKGTMGGNDCYGGVCHPGGNKHVDPGWTKKNGGALKKYQGKDGASTTGDDYWTADELTYLKGLPKAERDKIIAQGDKGRDAYNAYRKANDKPVTKSNTAPTVNKTEATTTANNTVTGTGTTGTTSTTGTTTGTGTTTNPPATTTKPGAFDGWTKTVIGGVEYAVDPSGRVQGYPYQTPAGPQGYYNNYNPYSGYGRGMNLGTISKNRLTPEFRKNMLAGNYDNAQLLGLSNIETRRAIDPGNRIKSMTFSYGQPIPGGRTTINQPAANNSASTPQTNTKPPVKSTPSATPVVKSNTPTVDPNDPRVVSPGVKAAEDYTFRPWQNLQDLPAEGPVNQNSGAGPRDTPSPDVTYDPFVSSYIPRYNTYPDLDNSGKVSPVKVMANNTVPETDTDPNLDPATDPRGANYGVEEYPEDLVLPEAGKVVQGSDGNYYVKLADGSIEKSIDREVLRRKTGFAKGGSLHRFMRMYQGDIGSSSVRDMSIADMPETVDQIVAPESNNTFMDFKPYEMTDADRVRAVDVGTEYEQLQPGDGMAPAFDVETKRRKKRIGNPEKDLAFINMATGLLNSRNAAYAETELRNRSQASQVFNPIRSMEGNYDILSGDFRRGKRAADGNDAFHSGFSTYAQMGGSMLENLKEGDEVYLTEEQINEILKRGGKLSYL
jgi:hypothetical protein